MTKDTCKHKYRTNLDGLVTKEAPSIYATVIFCEKCGHVKYAANASESERKLAKTWPYGATP